MTLIAAIWTVFKIAPLKVRPRIIYFKLFSTRFYPCVVGNPSFPENEATGKPVRIQMGVDL